MTLPPGFTPYADGFWPPDGSLLDVLHRDGSVTEAVVYVHWDILQKPRGFPLRRAVVGWKLHTGEGKRDE